MAKHKIIQFNRIPEDAARVVLLPMVLFYRVKRYYLPGIDRETLRSMEGALIAANHTGFSDSLILNAIFWKRRMHHLASEELMSGFKGKMLAAAGCIRIDRTVVDYSAVKECVRLLKEGYLIGMFPQGHIRGETIKGGAAVIAGMADVPIFPVYIEKRKHWWQRHKAVFAPPIIVSEHSKGKLPNLKEVDEISALLAQRIEEGERLLQEKGEA